MDETDRQTRLATRRPLRIVHFLDRWILNIQMNRFCGPNGCVLPDELQDLAKTKAFLSAALLSRWR